jgi:lysophospholipase L1-like esterase
MAIKSAFKRVRGPLPGFLFCLGAALYFGALVLAAGDSTPGPLPKVVLLGDSIRLGYTPIVEKELVGKAVIISPKENGGDSSNTLKHLDEWVIREQPAIVHFNCGIHDTKKTKTADKFQVPPDQYEANLRKIVERIRQETKATVLFATTTPILDERAAKSRTKAEYELLEASIEKYNTIAKQVMQDLKVPVDDLHSLLTDADKRAQLISGDGVHYTAEGREMLGKAVAQFIKKHLPAAEK